MKSGSRGYRQSARAQAASGNTERILSAAFDLYVERPFDQITLAAVAERAGVGLQTVIRRVGTKDGLVRAVDAWLGPQIAEGLGAPGDPDPARVAAAFRRHYDRWAPVIERTLTQAESSPALTANAENGRAAHRAWLSTTFAAALTASPAPEVLLARLVAVTGVEVWLVLTRHEHLTSDQAEQSLHLFLTATLEGPRP